MIEFMRQGRLICVALLKCLIKISVKWLYSSYFVSLLWGFHMNNPFFFILFFSKSKFHIEMERFLVDRYIPSAIYINFCDFG